MVTTPPSPASGLRLLDDQQMRRFITHGFVTLRTQAPREVHETIFRKLEEQARIGGQVGNNALPQVPELDDVLNDPVVRGGLTSVLGPGYVLHQHRYMHRNRKADPARPGVEPGWHKDSYWGYHGRLRGHRPWWAMVMYYPQDTTLEMGPTALLPGRQHYLTRAAGDMAGAEQLLGEAGTFALIHYDLWHAAWPSVSDALRFMCKFEFFRVTAPDAPAWACQDPAWREPAEDDLPVSVGCAHRLQWRRVWDWCAGQAPSHPDAGDRSVADLLADLDDASPQVRARAADDLGALEDSACRPDVVRRLVALLGDEQAEPVGINAAYALASLGAGVVEPLAQALETEFDWASELGRRHLAIALGELDQAAAGLVEAFGASGDPARRAISASALGAGRQATAATMDQLVKLSSDEDRTVRLWAVESLGFLGEAAGAATGALVERLSDEDAEIRFSAPISLARIGPAAAEATPALALALRDDNRYVRGHSVEALHRIDTPEARDVLIHHLKASRWCPITTPDSPFYP